MIATMQRRDSEPLRLEWRRAHLTTGHALARYRYARANGWHCGHWHRTAEDAAACALAKGAPMD